MTPEDEEFNRIEREAAMRMEAVRATVSQHEPVPENFMDALKFDVAMREWVGLTAEERIMCRSYDPEEAVAKTEAKLREKNT